MRMVYVTLLSKNGNYINPKKVVRMAPTQRYTEKGDPTTDIFFDDGSSIRVVGGLVETAQAITS